FEAARGKCYEVFGASSPNQKATVTPPSIRKSLPVTKAPSGPIKSAPTVPTSSGVPARPAADTSSIFLVIPPNALVSSCTTQADLLYTEPYRSVYRNPPPPFLRTALGPTPAP